MPRSGTDRILLDNRVPLGRTLGGVVLVSSDASVSHRGAVPDFGATVRLERLIGLADGAHHDLLVLAAPSGYGKSVLAARIASERFDEVVWVSMSDMPPDSLGAAALVARRLGADLPQADGGGLLAVELDESRVYSALGEASRGRDSARLCVVLDDVSVDVAQEWAAPIARALRRRAPRRAQLLLTTRRTDVSGSRNCCVLGVEDLRLRTGEAEQVARLVSPALTAGDSVSRLLATAHGQAALVAVLARHWDMHSDHVGAPAACPDIRGLIMELVQEQLGEESRKALLALAMLRSGTSKDVEEVLGRRAAGEIAHISRCLPLVRSGGSSGDGDGFSVHDLARDVLLADEFVATVPGARGVALSVADRLAAVGVPGRALELVAAHASSGELAEWLSVHGGAVTAAGFPRAVQAALDSLSPAELMRAPLVLLSAKVAADQEELDSAIRRAQVAARLASEAGDGATEVDAQLHLARVYSSAHRFLEAARILEPLLSGGRLDRDREALLLAHAGIGVGRAFEGDAGEARRHLSLALDMTGDDTLSSEARARALNYSVAAHIMAWGRVDIGLRHLRRALRLRAVSTKTREYLLGNVAGVHMEMGRLSQALDCYETLVAHHASLGGGEVTPTFRAIRAQSLAGQGRSEEGAALAKESIDACMSTGDDGAACDNLIGRSALLLGAGRHEEALSDAESALELAVDFGTPVRVNFASVLVRAALLALGDVEAAKRVEDARTWALAHEASHVAALTDLILAEAERLEGEAGRAIERVAAHAGYLLTDSLNWYSAMLVRAFPGLLGVLAGALGADRIPARMLAMIQHGDVELAHALAREVLDAGEFARLAARLPAATASVTAPAAPTAEGPACRVRLFGGLDIETPAGPLPDNAWRKRKGRLIFAMLVVRRGQEVAREIITDHLWPEMDDERARNNFHVVWSAMKGTLAPGTPRVKQCPYVTHVRGTCRMTPAVRSDLDEFDELVRAMRRGEEGGNAKAMLKAAEALIPVYRGELLPGEPYDDWFSQPREHYRHEFCDAMALASAVAIGAGDAIRALRFSRAGLAQDPWREDLYQSALTAQIAMGQRSAAVETYFMCRGKLVEDLGLDPSSETLRLYEQVLAMEEGAEGEGEGEVEG